MQTIQALFDGTNFIPLEKVPVSPKYKVITAFVEEIDETEEIRIWFLLGELCAPRVRITKEQVNNNL